MKIMLINAKYKDELRIALINNNILFDLYIENINYENKKFNIYKGKIIHIEQSLEAAFVDYGSNKHGFLSIKNISDNINENIIYNSNNKKKIIKDLINKDQDILIQINKDERNNKGASLTTFICLTGIYSVLIINNPNIRGISKKIIGKDRINIKKIIFDLKVPNNIGYIIRTYGALKKLEDIQSDIDDKIKLWKKIKDIYFKSKSPSLIYKENNIFNKIFKDYLTKDIDQIIIDDKDFLEEAKKYINIIGKYEFFEKIKIHSSNIPIFNYFKIESQVESIFNRKIRLFSGGLITIDYTEALTSIDINSSKSTKYIDIEETAFKTNLEAVYEIHKQLKFRDLSGLIIIDFIDMKNKKNILYIENKLRELSYKDRSKIKIGKISKFGLLELTRQRLNKSLIESNFSLCKKCKGVGFIRNKKSLSSLILRTIENELIKLHIKEIHVIVPTDIGIYLLNEKRKYIYDIEKKNFNKVRIVILPSDKIFIPNYLIIKINNKDKIYTTSYILYKTYINNNLYNKYSNIDYKKNFTFENNENNLFIKSYSNKNNITKIKNKFLSIINKLLSIFI